MIGYAICGSFCTISKSLKELAALRDSGEDIVPIISENVLLFDTRFGKAIDIRARAEEICGRSAVTNIKDAEPFGAAAPLEYMVISPCTGNTLAKIASGISDSTVTMAAKAHLRSDRPLLIALSTNDAMSQNLKNIGALLSRKAVYFVPMLQDDPDKKPHSLVTAYDMFEEAYISMKEGRQLRPLFLCDV